MTQNHHVTWMQSLQKPVLLATCLCTLPATALALTENYIPKGADYIFYTSLMAGILFASLIIIAYKEYKWLAYAGFAALLTLDLSAMDGTLAYLVGTSDYVLWLVPFLIHSITSSYGYTLIASHLDPSNQLVQYKPIFIGLAIVSALFPLTSFFWIGQIPLPILWLPVNMLFFIMILAQILPPLTWQASTQFETTLTKYMAVIIVGATLLLYGSHYLSEHSTFIELKDINRIALLVFAFGSLSIVILRLFIHNKEKEQAKQSALIAAKKQAETELTLLKLEHNYQDALTIASQHQSQLSSVSHDLKQPIAVLRLVLNQLKRTDNDIDTHRLDHAINYMDDLVQQLLASENLSESEIEDAAEIPPNDPQETITTKLLANTLEQMFQNDADSNQQQLTIRHHNVTLTIEPLTIMRLMNNLVANAINHAKASRILVTFRQRSDHLLFQVFDNGCGISQQALTVLRQSGQKSQDSEGHGLGLSIVQSLCEQHSIEFSIRSELNRGTQCALKIPLAVSK